MEGERERIILKVSLDICCTITYLSCITHSDPIKKLWKMQRGAFLNDFVTSWSMFGVLLPAPHHQLTQQNRTRKILCSV